MKKIIVIGGGFAGALISKNLQDDFNVTLVDTKDYFEFTPGVLRTIVEPEHAKGIQSRHKDYLHKAKVIVGEVTEISNKKVSVKSKGKLRNIGFDYLVISSGSKYNSPIKEKNLVLEARSEVFRRYHKRLHKFRDILIIGGGIVGVELAAEIITHNSAKNKKITIVHSHEKLMERNNERSQKYAENFFKKRNVDILFNERISGKEGKNFLTEKGTKIKTDLAFLCTGITPNFEFMKKNFSSFLNQHNHIKANSFLQLEGHENIFVAGDITAIEGEKTAQNAEKQAMIVVKNIRNLVAKKPLKEYKPGNRVMVISLGEFNGILTYKNFAIPGLIPGIVKTLIEWKTMARYR